MNTYLINLINDSGVVFDTGTFTNLKRAKNWAGGRGGSYFAAIHKNGARIPDIYTPRARKE